MTTTNDREAEKPAPLTAANSPHGYALVQEPLEKPAQESAVKEVGAIDSPVSIDGEKWMSYLDYQCLHELALRHAKELDALRKKVAELEAGWNFKSRSERKRVSIFADEKLQSENAALRAEVEYYKSDATTFRAEVAALRHDTERHVKHASELATELAALKKGDMVVVPKWFKLLMEDWEINDRQIDSGYAAMQFRKLLAAAEEERRG